MKPTRLVKLLARATSADIASGLMGKTGFEPFELPQIIGIKSRRPPQPMTIGCEVAAIEGIHRKVLSGIFITALVRPII